MRIRKKKHLEERLKEVSDMLIVVDSDIKDSRQCDNNKKLLNYSKTFGNSNKVELEIGCGKGGFITQVARKRTETNFIAVELLQNIIVMACEKAKIENLHNIKFLNCGAEYLKRYIPNNSINAIYLNFSPPYMKNKHGNRRLTRNNPVFDYRDFLVDGGIVYLKTDDKDFFEYSMQSFAEVGFVLHRGSTEYNCEQTEYEKKFIEKGLPIYSFYAMKDAR